MAGRTKDQKLDESSSCHGYSSQSVTSRDVIILPRDVSRDSIYSNQTSNHDSACNRNSKKSRVRNSEREIGVCNDYDHIFINPLQNLNLEGYSLSDTDSLTEEDKLYRTDSVKISVATSLNKDNNIVISNAIPATRSYSNPEKLTLRTREPGVCRRSGDMLSARSCDAMRSCDTVYVNELATKTWSSYLTNSGDEERPN